MKEIKEGKIKEIIYDDKNFNKHTEKGMELLEKSITELGLGRSIIIDKNNKIIGGNGVVETANSLGFEDVIVVPTDGKKLVAVKRMDIDLNTKKGRELALADNSTAQVNLDWDLDALNDIAKDFEIDIEDWALQEIFTGDIDDFFTENNGEPKEQKFSIVLHYTEEEYLQVKEKIKEIGGTPEHIIYNLLGLK